MDSQSSQNHIPFPLLYCQNYDSFPCFVVDIILLFVSRLTKRHTWSVYIYMPFSHSEKGTVSLRQQRKECSLKKPITMLMFLLMLLPLLKVLYSFFGYEWTVWIQTKSFLCLFFISSWQVYRYSPAHSSLLHEIQCAIACRTGWLLRRFSRQTEALRAYLRLTKINSVVQPKYGNSKQCRTSSVSTLSHLNLSRLMACLKQHSTNLPTYSHPKGLKLSQRVRT